MSEIEQCRKIGSIAARLAVMVLAAYQRDEAAAMLAFGSNAGAHVANELAGKLMAFKIAWPPKDKA